MKLLRAYANKTVTNLRSDRILPWSIDDDGEGGYLGKGGWAGY